MWHKRATVDHAYVVQGFYVLVVYTTLRTVLEWIAMIISCDYNNKKKRDATDSLRQNILIIILIDFQLLALSCIKINFM